MMAAPYWNYNNLKKPVINQCKTADKAFYREKRYVIAEIRKHLSYVSNNPKKF